MIIKAERILEITEKDLPHFHLFLASNNGTEQPLNTFLRNGTNWLNYEQVKNEKTAYNRPYIFCLIPFYHEANKWLFGGIFKISNESETNFGKNPELKIELTDLHKEMIGRLVIDFFRHQGMRNVIYDIENYYKDFLVSAILKKPFDGIHFPGYDNLKLDFWELESIFKNQKHDWKSALSNVKGIYAITDKSNGKQYVDAAWGNWGIWEKWGIYLGKGKVMNNEITQLITEKGIEYARAYFQFSLLEKYHFLVDDSIISERKIFWEKVFWSKVPFGYNKN
jgi:hypothetical protein